MCSSDLAGTYMLAPAASRGEVLVENVISTHLHPVIAKLQETGCTVEEQGSALYVKVVDVLTAVDVKTLPYPGSARCIHGGAAFIWPVFQNYAFLDLTPISIECNLTNALSKQNIRVDVPCRFTVGISTEPESMTNAAERLLGQNTHNIQNIATDILFGQLRLAITTMDIEEIKDRKSHV